MIAQCVHEHREKRAAPTPAAYNTQIEFPMDGNLHTVLQVCFDSGVGRRHGEGAVGVVRDLIFRELW